MQNENGPKVVVGVDMANGPDEIVYAIYDVKTKQVQVINPKYKTDEELEDAIVEACTDLSMKGRDVMALLRHVGLDDIGARNRSIDRAIIKYESLPDDDKFVADMQSVSSTGKTIRQQLESQKIRRDDTTN